MSQHPTASSTESHFGAQLFVQELQQRFADTEDLRILVAGCGSGHEAFYIRESTGARVDSMDIQDFLKVPQAQRAEINFVVGSVCDLPYDSQSFDAVFYYHVIEHVEDPDASLEEIHRVTKNDGWVFVGTPNRNRIFSSLGAHTQSEWNPTVWNKLLDNLRDWKDRLRGRFHNHFGAHAGFTTRELDSMASRSFTDVEWVTQQYIRGKYRDNRLFGLIKLLTASPFHYVLAPSIYAWCRK